LIRNKSRLTTVKKSISTIVEKASTRMIIPSLRRRSKIRKQTFSSSRLLLKKI